MIFDCNVSPFYIKKTAMGKTTEPEKDGHSVPTIQSLYSLFILLTHKSVLWKTVRTLMKWRILLCTV